MPKHVRGRERGTASNALPSPTPHSQVLFTAASHRPAVTCIFLAPEDTIFISGMETGVWRDEFSGTQMAPLSRGESQALTGFLSWTYAFCPHRSWHVWCQPSSRGQAELLLQVRSQELSSTTMEGTHSRVTSDHGPWYQELPMTF